MVFTDASWQDCPDTGRSTTGFLMCCCGGVIEANSVLQMPVHVAMSSCEAEVVACCSGCMAAAHMHITKHYNASTMKQI
jgi:hypothetical protein